MYYHHLTGGELYEINEQTYFGDNGICFDTWAHCISIDLNGGELNVNGNLYQPSGYMNVNNGTLNICGWYKIVTETVNNKGEASYSVGGELRMANSFDSVNVDGDFYILFAAKTSKYCSDHQWISLYAF